MRLLAWLSVLITISAAGISAQSAAPAAPATTPPTPTDIKAGSITCDECPYPYPSSYLPFTTYGQEVRLAYMDVPPMGTPNGHTVVLFHGMNFAGFHWVLQQLKIERAMIVGHSMGGMLAARFATQYPEMTERLVPRKSFRIG